MAFNSFAKTLVSDALIALFMGLVGIDGAPISFENSIRPLKLIQKTKPMAQIKAEICALDDRLSLLVFPAAST